MCIKQYTSGYADEIVGYVVNKKSIDPFFAEFERWFRYSGAKNKYKQNQDNGGGLL